MTAKEMAHWERWRRRGRRKFQLTIALIWFLAFGLGRWLLGLAMNSDQSLFGYFGTALLLSIVFYVSSGYHWDHRTDDYLQQRRTDSSGSTLR